MRCSSLARKRNFAVSVSTHSCLRAMAPKAKAGPKAKPKARPKSKAGPAQRVRGVPAFLQALQRRGWAGARGFWSGQVAARVAGYLIQCCGEAELSHWVLLMLHKLPENKSTQIIRLYARNYYYVRTPCRGGVGWFPRQRAWAVTPDGRVAGHA